MFCLTTGIQEHGYHKNRNSISVVQCEPLHVAKRIEGVMFFANNLPD